MFLELIATIVAGVGAAGVVLLLGRLMGGRLPRWGAPVAAGLAMLAATIWSEYDWEARTVAGLPEGMTVIETVEETALHRPWTYLAPLTTRLAALDVAGIQTNPEAPGVKLAEVWFFGRWRPVDRAAVMIRCAPAAQARVSDAALADVSAAEWRPMPADDPLVAAACAEAPAAPGPQGEAGADGSASDA
ncbi:hypothetical protein [Albimonas pacifica]|uniref:Uncharacterized protein n=1 Tax=Albimonas pacifica TaxID=1114924 RepID=A0A1I3P5D3_9RHOB|nr:hypothetical protein [Albimonas pacifica]SFJ16642.1 hypothetical protein SAMN05216258_11567 [Albimonas pacifica]